MKAPVAVVTGAARGIGQAVAIALGRRGADVVVCDLLPQQCVDDTIHGIESAGGRACYRLCDVGQRGQVEALFNEALDRFGRVDILVNNAGINIPKLLLDLEVEEAARVWSVDLWGTFHCSQVAARQMVRQGGGGCIVVISSTHADRAFQGSTAYGGAKAAITQMARIWALELAPYRIRVNVVEPGWTETPGERALFGDERLRQAGRKLPLGRMARPDEIASAISFLASQEAAYITGAVLRVDGGIALTR